MTALIRWVESKIKIFTIWDLVMIKISLISFSLLIAKLLPIVLSLEWYWYAMIFLAAYAWILSRMLGTFEKP